MITAGTCVRTEVPVDIGRDEARDAAARELSDPSYRAHDPSWPERALAWVLERLEELLNGVAGVTPGGALGLIVLLVLAVLVAVIVRLRVGKIARTERAERAIFGERTASAAEHRAAAQAALARGDHAEAVTELFRAIVRELEQRGVLRVTGGLTADEVADAAGAVLPRSAAGLREAARTFDDVYYGGHPATIAEYHAMSTVDDQVRSERLAPAVPI